MKKYKVYSFDLWLTLIKSHPLYKEYRTHIFNKEFNPLHYSFDEVKLIIRQIESFCNRTNELVGRNINNQEIICMILDRLGNNVKLIDVNIINQIEKESRSLIFKYPPQLFSSDTKSTLSKLNEFANLYLISNTGYINGDILSEILDVIGIRKYFKQLIFSDDIGYSKPNPQIFAKLLSYLPNNITLENIIHVGDKYAADVKGPSDVKISSYQINSNANNITDLLL